MNTYSEDIEAKLNRVEFWVEATSFEAHTLWKEYSGKCEWVADMLGTAPTIGHLKVVTLETKIYPVVISLTFNSINGRHFAFFDPVSQFVDSEMVREWIKSQCKRQDDGFEGRWPITDAMNFHICYDFLTSKPQS